ncbi:MAG: 5-formyltetrahydrofolate cyclo-ligase [Lachnospiraceae bacterium]|nr:5-formyltetrahydrofolate cyclo-ligase [Lachnospiraceae bacterium]
MKENIRKEALAARKNLTKEERVEKSFKICSKFIKSRYFSESQIIFVYFATPYEVDTSMILKTSFKESKRVALPVSYDDGAMYFAEISDINGLYKGNFGVFEPDKSLKEVLPQKGDVFIVPGVAFDYHKNRLGHGKGFYDRYFSKYKDTIKIGLAYGVQLFESIPSEENDVKMDFIITENGFI